MPAPNKDLAKAFTYNQVSRAGSPAVTQYSPLQAASVISPGMSTYTLPTGSTMVVQHISSKHLTTIYNSSPFSVYVGSSQGINDNYLLESGNALTIDSYAGPIYVYMPQAGTIQYTTS